MSKLLTLILLLLVVAAAYLFGRDLYSREVRVVKGTVVEYDRVGRDLNAQALRTPSYRVKLEDGQEIDAATSDSTGLAPGSPVEVIEFHAPWGEAWYKKSGK